MTPFSVSMCVYGKDNPVFFKQAVESVLDQTVKPSEVVLVVDGPVPTELDEIIIDYEQNPIFNVVRLEKNQGHGIARQTGLEKCSYNLVAIMDADDINVQNRFELQLKKFEQDSSLDIVGGYTSHFVNDPQKESEIHNVPEDDAAIKKYLKKRCPMRQNTVMFKKDSVLAVGGYQDWFCNEDYFLWIRMVLAEKKFANIPHVLVHAREGFDRFKRRGGMRYFISNAKIQWLMFKKNLISFPRYAYNVAIRFCTQVLMPNKIRGIMANLFASKRV